MKRENQVTSLGPSKRLNELGVKQDSYWVWINPFKMEDLEHFYDINTEKWDLIPRTSIMPSKVERPCYAAFTVAELGQKLLSFVEQRGEKYYLLITRTNKTEYSNLPDFYVGYRNVQGTHFLHSKRDDNEANSRAKMRIWLIENKLVEVK